MSDRFACLIDGPLWWGDEWLAPTGRPAVDAAITAERRSDAADERRAVLAAVETLPDTCLLVHTGSRGAAQLAVQAAARRRLPVAAVPPFPADPDHHSRNAAVVDILAGLSARSWRVKALIAIPSGGSDAAALAASATDLAARCRSASIPVRILHPLPEPDPEPEPEPNTDGPQP